MEIWQIIVLAVIEGVTEFLPISSTAHLMFAATMMGITQNEYVKSFEIVIQLGAILSILFIYVSSLVKNPKLIKDLIIAFLPTGLIGVVMYKTVKTYLIGNDFLAIVMIFVGGVLLVSNKMVSKGEKNKQGISDLNISQILFIGLMQSISMIPGVSRALVTIWGGLLVGLDKKAAVEMSFLLALPTMAAATGMDLIKTGVNFESGEWLGLGVGMFVAFICATLVVKWLTKYVQEHDFKLFGWYRLILAGLLVSISVFR